MTKDEAIQKLKDLESMDPESAHGEADSILLKYLGENGAKEVADAWCDACVKIGFWYA